jgi:hypothetical protein
LGIAIAARTLEASRLRGVLATVGVAAKGVGAGIAVLTVDR